jgi:leucine dehydrogenase
MRACAETVWGTDSLQGRRIAIQGFGNVASSLAAYLLDAGAELIVTDIHQAALRQAKQLPRTTTVAVETIYDTACDIFAPCALGGVLNHDTIPRLRCSVICGAANNQLAEAGDADLLTSRSILYAPDYIANAGGVTNVFYELERPYNRDAALAKTARIYNTMKTVLDFSSTLGLSTAAAADKMAEDRLGKVKAARNR